MSARAFLSPIGARLNPPLWTGGPGWWEMALTELVEEVLPSAEPVDQWLGVDRSFEYETHPVAHRRKVGTVHVHAVSYRPFGCLAEAIESVLLPELDRLIDGRL